MTATPFLTATVGVDHPQLSVDVELRGNRRDIIGLVGPNGAGKTTVLRAIAGLQPLDRGRIVIDGVVVDDAAADILVASPQRRVGVVFQDYRLFPNLSALDNVAFGLRCRDHSRREARLLAAPWLDRMDLTSHQHARPAALSGGQAQRVDLARALATQPDVLLLDEPLAAIDPSARGRIRDDLGRYLQDFDGITVIVSHQHGDITALAGQAIALDAGRVVWTGPAADLPRTT